MPWLAQVPLRSKSKSANTMLQLFPSAARRQPIFLGSGMTVVRGTGWIDPLKGPSYDLRLHNHRYQITGYRECIVVSGAGTADANGRYYSGQPSYFTKPGTGYAVGHNIGYGDGWYLALGVDFLYQSSADANPDHSSVEDVTWSVLAGEAPVPTFTLIQEPQYRPWGMFQDEACTVPATLDGHVVKRWRDEITGNAYALSQDNSVIAGVLRFAAGVPEIEWNGSTEMTVPEIRGPDYSFNSTMAVSAVVTSVFPHVTYDCLCGFDPLGTVYTGRSIFVVPPPEMVSLDAYGSSLGVGATVDPVELITVTASWRDDAGGRADLITNRGEVINGAVPMAPCNDVAFNAGRGNGGSRPIMRLRHLVIPTGLAEVTTMRMIQGGLESW